MGKYEAGLDWIMSIAVQLEEVSAKHALLLNSNLFFSKLNSYARIVIGGAKAIYDVKNSCSILILS